VRHSSTSWESSFKNDKNLVFVSAVIQLFPFCSNFARSNTFTGYSNFCFEDHILTVKIPTKGLWGYPTESLQVNNSYSFQNLFPAHPRRSCLHAANTNNTIPKYYISGEMFIFLLEGMVSGTQIQIVQPPGFKKDQFIICRH
jgi:hypothetical protein